MSTAAHAAHRAVAPPGPVHLNLPFREPLGAQPDGTDAAAYLADLRAGPVTDVMFPPGSTEQGDARVAAAWLSDVQALGPSARGVVVLGAGVDGREQAAARAAAERFRWPLLEDVLADGEGERAGSPAVPGFDLLLASEEARRALRPNAVLHLGGRPTSKRLALLIDDARPQAYLVARRGGGRLDPSSVVTHRVHGGIALCVQNMWLAMDTGPFDPAPERWLAQWRAASVASRRAAYGEVDGSGLSEPFVARALMRQGWPDGLVVAGASMPVRDLEASAGSGGVSAVANRGASGIDGTVATASGLARGQRVWGGPRRVTALVGDLALLHDQTSLALLRDGPPVVVVCVNNDGGGIFHRLPIASGEGALANDTFERFFGTPHGLTFEHAAAQFGLAYHRPTTQAAFEAALDAAVASGASALIEVQTNREEQAALRRRIEAACAEAVDQALAELDG